MPSPLARAPRSSPTFFLALEGWLRNHDKYRALPDSANFRADPNRHRALVDLFLAAARQAPGPEMDTDVQVREEARRAETRRGGARKGGPSQGGRRVGGPKETSRPHRALAPCSSPSLARQVWRAPSASLRQIVRRLLQWRVFNVPSNERGHASHTDRARPLVQHVQRREQGGRLLHRCCPVPAKRAFACAGGTVPHSLTRAPVGRGRRRTPRSGTGSAPPWPTAASRSWLWTPTTRRWSSAQTLCGHAPTSASGTHRGGSSRPPRLVPDVPKPSRPLVLRPQLHRAGGLDASSGAHSDGDCDAAEH